MELAETRQGTWSRESTAVERRDDECRSGDHAGRDRDTILLLVKVSMENTTIL